MNDKSVYRTAPATQGLLKIQKKYMLNLSLLLYTTNYILGTTLYNATTTPDYTLDYIILTLQTSYQALHWTALHTTPDYMLLYTT